MRSKAADQFAVHLIKLEPVTDALQDVVAAQGSRMLFCRIMAKPAEDSGSVRAEKIGMGVGEIDPTKPVQTPMTGVFMMGRAEGKKLR